MTTFTIGKSSNANLSALTVNQGTLSPVFTASTTAYTVNVANSVSSITVSATKADVNATVTGAGEKQLNVGENIISVVVTAQDGATKKTYTITVNRAPVPNANLSALTVDKGTLFPAFDVNITNYSLTVDKTVTGINIIGIAVDTAADISGSGYHSIDANYKQINIVVKSSDRSTTKTYSIVVIKELPTVEEDIKAVPLTAYPNPARDFVTIGGLQENGKLSVFDAVGQVRIQHNITSTQETISLSALPKGIYIVQVVEGDKKRTIKIIVE